MKTVFIPLYLLTLVLLMSFIKNAKADQESLYNKITSLQPNIDKKFAKRLAKYIDKYSKEFDLDPNISIAIAMQESSLTNKNRTIKSVVKRKNGKIEEIKEVTDVSIFQFHVKTIEYHNMDAERLFNDLDYCVRQHFKLLKKKIQQCSKYEDSWACYHSKTPALRKKYAELVKRWMDNEK